MPYKEGRKWRGTVKHRGERYTSSHLTKRAAASWENQTRNALTKASRKQQKGMDLITFVTRYLDYATRYQWKTYDEKRSLCKRILIAWDPHIPVVTITPAMVLTYLEKRAKDVSGNAFNKDRKNLTAMWRWGQEIFDIETDPLKKIKKRSHDRKVQYTPPTVDILSVIAAAEGEDSVLLECVLNTAARRSEILRLTWMDDINLERGNVRLGTRKTSDGSIEYKWMPMTDDLNKALRHWWDARNDKRSPHVFPTYYLLNPQTGVNKNGEQRANRKLKALCKRAGVKPFGFHGIRRYVASVLADTHKVSAKKIQGILRHKSLATTERYIKAIEGDMKSTLELVSVTKVHIEGTHNENKEPEQEPVTP
jgi:integrase